MLNQTPVTVISFFVSVPVLSEQIMDVDPSVSTHRDVFNSTERSAILRAANESKEITATAAPEVHSQQL
jgi:hypothetical protein